MARKSNLLESLDSITAGNSESSANRKRSSLPAGAVGALAAGLQNLTANGMQEIDTSKIDSNGPADRLEIATVDDASLKSNIEKYGQLVPVLVRPHPDQRGRYQIIYGRRRLKACEELGIPVKANVRDLNDNDCVIAQGQENSARKDLSYYERCRFALAIEDSGYDRTTIQAALNVGKSHVSEYLKIAKNIPSGVGDLIGPAAGIGRDRWENLRKMFENNILDDVRAKSLLQKVIGEHPKLSSDERFLLLLKEGPKQGVLHKNESGTSAQRDLEHGATIKSSATSVTIKFRKSEAGFDRWIDRNAHTLITELHDRFRKETGEEN